MGPQFTPGPWHIKYERTGPNTAEMKVVNSLLVVATVHSDKSDAQMLSAAPELYEALSSVLEYIKGAPVNIMSDVDRALEKANGRTAALSARISALEASQLTT